MFQKGEHSAICVSDNQPRVQKSHCGESLDDTLRANWRLFGASPPPLSSLLSREDRLAKTRFHAPPVDSRSLATRRILKLFLKFLELSCGEISVGGSIASCNRLCVFSESHREGVSFGSPLCCWCIPSLCSLSHRRRLVRGLEISVSHGYPGCKPSDNKEAVQHYVNGASVGALCLLLTADIFLVLVEEAEGGVLHDRWSLTEMVFNFIDDRGRR